MITRFASKLNIVVAALPLLAACIVLPVSPIDITHRTNIGDDVPTFVAVGKTSKTELLRTLGQPDYFKEDESEFLYLVLRSTGGLWMTAGYNAALLAKVRFRALFVTFDEYGIVESATLEKGLCVEEPRTAQCGSRIAVLNLVRGLVVSVAGWCRAGSHDSSCPKEAVLPDPPDQSGAVTDRPCAAASCFDGLAAACPCGEAFLAAIAIYDERPGTPTAPEWSICSESRDAVGKKGVVEIHRKNDLDAFVDTNFVTVISLFAHGGRTFWGTDWAQCSADVHATNWSHGSERLYKTENRTDLSDAELEACANLMRMIANCPD